MRYPAQFSANDPVQTCHPQFVPDISFALASNRPLFGKSHSHVSTQELVDQSFCSWPESKSHPAPSRKRSRKDVKDDFSSKSVPDQSITQLGTDNKSLREGKSTTEWESWKATTYFARLPEEQVKQGRLKRHAMTNLEYCSPPMSRFGGFVNQQPSIGVTTENNDNLVHKSARLASVLSECHSETISADFKCPLGVGWSVLSKNDPDLQAAVRGWVKFIENHFPVTDVKIRLQNKGLACFLIEAAEGYYLFGDDLKQCRFVSANLDRTWSNLQGPVPIFEGETFLKADEISKIQCLSHQNNWLAWENSANRSNSTNPVINLNEFGKFSGDDVEVKMDVC